MSDLCRKIHNLFNSFEKLSFPFEKSSIPANGIYILFEKNESAHDVHRIVRIGTHTGPNQLRSRLNQHFIKENKNRSIFRKNIGRCFLNMEKDPYLDIWNLDTTSKKEKVKNINLIHPAKEVKVEKRVTERLQKNFTFCVFQVDDKDDRLWLESKLISTISNCPDCLPSKKWLGKYSPISKIKESGLWLVQGLYKESFSEEEFMKFKEMITKYNFQILNAPCS